MRNEMEEELAALREEVAALRREIATLRSVQVVYHYHGPLPQFTTYQPHAPLPSYLPTTCLGS